MKEKQSVGESAQACRDFNLHSLVIRGRINQEGQASKEETEPLVCVCMCHLVRETRLPHLRHVSSMHPSHGALWTGGGGLVPVEGLWLKGGAGGRR